MAWTEEKKQKWEGTLRELNLLDADDSIEEQTVGDYWQLMGQTKGNYFFTKEKLIFVSGFGVNNFVIKYSDIKSIQKSMVSLFIPTGVTITADDPESGKTKKYKCSLSKRTKWMELLSEKANVPI